MRSFSHYIWRGERNSSSCIVRSLLLCFPPEHKRGTAGRTQLRNAEGKFTFTVRDAISIFSPAPLFSRRPSDLQTLCYDERTVLEVVDTGAMGESYSL